MERRDSKKFLNARYWSCFVLFQFLIVAAFCLVIGKAFCLQVVDYSKWQAESRAQSQTTLQVPSYRGSIVDRHGRLLSYSVPQCSLYVDGDMVEDPKQLARQLAPIIGEHEAALQKKLTTERRFVWLKRHMTDQQALAVEGLKAKGIGLADEYKRFYPYRQVAGQVVGFVGMDGAGLEGVEKAFDKELRASDQTVGQMRDGIKRCLWLQSSLPPEPGEGLGVRLTIDAFIQYICEYELEKIAIQYKAKAAEIVVLDPNTSEVLAMANWPFFDPNAMDKKGADAWRNRIITNSFEPGSTFKVFLMSAALEEGVVKDRDRIFCENGKCKLAGHMINDTHPYGWLTVSEVIKYSSNIAASKLALQLGNERYYRYIKGFGFGAETGISLPGEVKGLVRSCKRWRPIDLATTGFGQSIGVTALQLNAAVAAIANGGEYAPPVIARELVDAKGKRARTLDAAPARRVIQKKTAQKICEMMKTVTQEGGTGVQSVPEGYTVAGKTGTAQTLDPVTRRYACNKYTSLFTGFVPADHPRLVITVVVHEPQGAIYGGVVAAPVFRNVAARALPYLGVLPSTPVGAPPPPTVRSVSAGGKAPVAKASLAAPAGSCDVRTLKPKASVKKPAVQNAVKLDAVQKAGTKSPDKLKPGPIISSAGGLKPHGVEGTSVD